MAKLPEVTTVIEGPNTAGRGTKPVKNKNEVIKKLSLKNLKITRLSYLI